MDADALEFARALISSRASEELGERAADFDWLVGKWSAIVRDYNDDGTSRRMRVTAPVIDAFLCASGERRRTSAFAYDDRTHAFAHQLCNEVGASQGTH